MDKLRILVLGGCGNFGAHICRRLANDGAFTLIAITHIKCGYSPYVFYAQGSFHACFAMALKVEYKDVLLLSGRASRGKNGMDASHPRALNTTYPRRRAPLVIEGPPVPGAVDKSAAVDG